MSGFGWSYPPGCDGVPDDIAPEQEFDPFADGRWPPDEGEDIPAEPDLDFISDVPDEFPGGF